METILIVGEAIVLTSIAVGFIAILNEWFGLTDKFIEWLFKE